MYGKLPNAYNLLTLSRAEALLFLTLPAFEGLHDDLKNFALLHSQRKLLTEKERQSECKYTIVITRALVLCLCYNLYIYTTATIIYVGIET